MADYPDDYQITYNSEQTRISVQPKDTPECQLMNEWGYFVEGKMPGDTLLWGFGKNSLGTQNCHIFKTITK